MKYDFQPACELLADKQNIVIVGHVSPDGDTLGSSLGLARGLKKLGRQVRVVFQDKVPRHLSFLPGAAEILTPEQLQSANNQPPDLLILVDCATLERTGNGWIEAYLPQTPLLIFDHHALRDDIPAVSLVDAHLAATAELIYWFLQELKVPLDLDLARCLYTGICTDTGGFRFTNTKVHTLQIAAELLTQGINMEEMRVQLFESRSLGHLKMLGLALFNMQKTADNKLVWCSIDAETKQRYNALPEDIEGIAGETMQLEGVKIGLFFDERAEKGVVKVSMRGRDGYNVGKLAAEFGGGGHYAASGCTISGSLAEVMPQVLKAAERLLAETEARL